MKQSIILKALAATAGAGLTAVATYMNAEHIAAAEGCTSPLTIGTVLLTVSGAMALPLAEYAYKTGQWLKAAFLVLFFALVLVGSLMNTLARTASFRDGQVANGQQINAHAQLAKEAYVAAQQTVTSECAKRGSRCRAAETALTAARGAVSEVAPAKPADPAATRLAAIFGISESAVALYVPLILPTALELGGFLLLALGLAGGTPIRPTAKIVDQIKQDALAIKPKAGTRAYYLARLQAERPDLAAIVEAGELSVHAASIEAGMRRARKAKSKWTTIDAYARQPVEA